MENTPLCVGLIGSGAISGIYLQNLTGTFSSAVRVKAVASLHIANARKKAAEYHLPAVSVDELLADREIRMVVILTPVGTHYELIRRALLAGKHVYTEKTIADTLAHAGELLALADTLGLYLGSAPDSFLGAACQTGRAVLDSGTLGTVHSFSISVTRNNDFLLSLFSFLRAPGCSVLLDYAVYYLAWLCNLLGPVAEVCAFSSAPCQSRTNILPSSPEYGQRFASPNTSIVTAILRMENGITGTLHVNAETIQQDIGDFILYGTKGILQLPSPNCFGGDVFLNRVGDAPGETAPRELVPNRFLYAENSRGIGPAEMAAAIREGRPNRASKTFAYHVLDVLTCIAESSENGGRPVPVCSTAVRPEALPPDYIP